MADRPTSPPPPPPPPPPGEDIGLPQVSYPGGKMPLDIRVIDWLIGGWRKPR